MFVTLNRIDDRNQQDFIQSGAAGMLPIYQPERATVLRGKLVYQDLDTVHSLGSFEQAVEYWNEYGGDARPKITTDLLSLTDGQPSQVGEYYNNFMVRMQGCIHLSAPGEWILYCNQDDEVAVRLGNASGYHGGATSTISQICAYEAVNAGWAEFDMVFCEGGGNQYYKFYIKGPTDSAYRELLPADVGYSPKLLAEDYVY